MPYLVFEIDQSERATLAGIAAAVFAATFLGALLVRLVGMRVTFAIAIAVLTIGRVAFQLTDSPGARWMLAAATIVACLWALIVLLPGNGSALALGIGAGFLVDLILLALRGTLDLPWMPGTVQHLVSLAILGAIVAAAFGLIPSDALSPLEHPWVSSLRYIGIGSGVALWLVASGNLGFAELRSGFGLPGAFALLAIGVLLALLLASIGPFPMPSPRAEKVGAVALGLLGAIALLLWLSDLGRWLDLVAVPAFAFSVTALTIRSAAVSGLPTTPGRWRTAAAVTVGVLLQAAFLFLFFARTGPMELMLAPLAVLTVAATIASPAPRRIEDNRPSHVRAMAVAVAVVALTFAWLLVDEPGTSATRTDSAGLTVMTFNIQEGFSRENIWSLEATARAIEEHDPDIVVLQEITRGWLVMSSADQVRWLANRLDMDYVYAGNSHDGLWGNAILSRLPIIASSSITFSTTENLRRGAVAAEVATANGNLLVIATHLDNPFGATDVRLQQIDELLAFWDGATPAIIAGDFNADPGNAEWQTIVDAGFIDSGDATSETTSEDERRIDYIFVTPDLLVEAFSVPDVWVSDHRPVVVELSPAA